MYLTQAIHRAAQQTPESTATICAGRVRTFCQLRDRIGRLAGGLRAIGLRTGDRVAVLAGNSDRYLELLFAVPWAGGVIVPLNLRWSPAEVGHALADSQAAIVIADQAGAAILDILWAGSTPPVRTIIWRDGSDHAARLQGPHDYEELAAGGPPADDERRGGDDLAGLFYTGGPSGQLRGVMLSHTNLVSSALSFVAAGDLLRRGARVLHVAPLFHLGGLSMLLAQSVLGGPHVVIPRFEAESVAGAVRRHGITHMLLVPTMIKMLVDHPGIGPEDFSTLKQIVYGGSAITAETIERAMWTFPHVAFVQAYGMTELGPLATYAEPVRHATAGSDRDDWTTAGRAAVTAEIRIVDPTGVDAAPGVVGEIHVRGPGAMLGYWNRPADTAAALRDGWLCTGDLGRLDDRGRLHIVPRRHKRMIITGGENVYLAETERALASHPAIASCTVFGRPDPELGESVHALAVLRPGCAVDAAQLRAHVKARIAGYKTPGTIDFVPQLPAAKPAAGP